MSLHSFHSVRHPNTWTDAAHILGGSSHLSLYNIGNPSQKWPQFYFYSDFKLEQVDKINCHRVQGYLSKKQMNRLMYSFSLSLAKVSVTKDHDCGLPTVEVDFSGPAGWKSKDR